MPEPRMGRHTQTPMSMFHVVISFNKKKNVSYTTAPVMPMQRGQAGGSFIHLNRQHSSPCPLQVKSLRLYHHHHTTTSRWSYRSMGARPPASCTLAGHVRQTTTIPFAIPLPYPCRTIAGRQRGWSTPKPPSFATQHHHHAPALREAQSRPLG